MALAAPANPGIELPTIHVAGARAAARGYIALGYAVVPVKPGTKKAFTHDWPLLRITADEVEAYFPVDSNIGILTGSASGGLVDVDLDCEEAITLAPEFLPPTPAKTGRASRPESHWWYRSPGALYRAFEDPVSEEMIAEIRGDNHQTVVGPSIHPSGEQVEELRGEPAPVDAEHLAECVQRLANAVLKRRFPEGVPHKRRPTPHLGPRTHDIPSASVIERAIKYLAKMPPAISGQRGHDRTYAAATTLVHGFELAPEDALRLLMEHFNPRCEPPWTELELRHKVGDAATKPHSSPRGWLLQAHPIGDDAGRLWMQVGLKESLVDHPLTDLGNAERLAVFAGGRLRYCGEHARWLVWDGTRWISDSTDAAVRLAGETARALGRAGQNLADDDRRTRIVKFALQSESRRSIDSAVHLAQSQEAFALRAGDLDADPWALSTLNGTIDLRNGNLRPHAAEDYITRLVPARYAPGTPCPRFKAFIERVLSGDRSLIAFVQKFLGMCLTGDASEQRLMVLVGDGANGKSVLMDLVKRLLSDHAIDAPPSLLCDSGRAEHPTELADLRGRRLVVASETEREDAFKLQTLKRLTGDATLKGRFMRGDYFEFSRTHKLVLVTNHLPAIREDSEAAWRRILVVPFDLVIPESERDTRLLEILWAERDGVLSWLVEGCLAWQREGLVAPLRVTSAVAAYRLRDTSLGRFIDECLVIDPVSAEATPWAEIWNAYQAWCGRSGRPCARQQFLGEALRARGCGSITRRVDGAARKVRVGVRIIGQPGGAGACAMAGVTAVTDVTGVAHSTPSALLVSSISNSGNSGNGGNHAECALDEAGEAGLSCRGEEGRS